MFCEIRPWKQPFSPKSLNSLIFLQKWLIFNVFLQGRKGHLFPFIVNGVYKLYIFTIPFLTLNKTKWYSCKYSVLGKLLLNSPGCASFHSIRTKGSGLQDSGFYLFLLNHCRMNLSVQLAPCLVLTGHLHHFSVYPTSWFSSFLLSLFTASKVTLPIIFAT